MMLCGVVCVTINCTLRAVGLVTRCNREERQRNNTERTLGSHNPIGTLCRDELTAALA